MPAKRGARKHTAENGVFGYHISKYRANIKKYNLVAVYKRHLSTPRVDTSQHDMPLWHDVFIFFSNLPPITKKLRMPKCHPAVLGFPQAPGATSSRG
jgi:hypothetical protein